MQCCGQGEGEGVQKKLNAGTEWSADVNVQQTNLISFPRSSSVDLPYRLACRSSSSV